MTRSTSTSLHRDCLIAIAAAFAAAALRASRSVPNGARGPVGRRDTSETCKMRCSADTMREQSSVGVAIELSSVRFHTSC